MTEEPDLLAIFLQFALLAAISVGGANSVLPELQRYVVEVNPWLTARQFAEVYALAQAAPGPNVLYVTLLGQQIAGVKGALTTTLATLLPPVAIAWTVVRLASRRPGAPLGQAIRVGLSPITIGLTFSAGWILARSVNHEWQGYAITVAATVLALRTRLNPLWLIGAGALAGIGGFV